LHALGIIDDKGALTPDLGENVSALTS